jgi:hypothetical protein
VFLNSSALSLNKCTVTVSFFMVVARLPEVSAKHDGTRGVKGSWSLTERSI